MYFDTGFIDAIGKYPETIPTMPRDQMIAHYENALQQRKDFKKKKLMEMGIDTFNIYWNDLTPDCQRRLEEFLGDNGNYDVCPITIITREVNKNEQEV